jgi:hypothetical protein
MAARYLDRKPGHPLVLGAVHPVTIEGVDFVARCGVRWSRRADGILFPEHYAGEVCEACKAVTT